MRPALQVGLLPGEAGTCFLLVAGAVAEVVPSPRRTIVLAASAESRPSRYAVAARAWTRRPTA
jgi:hypothetical protein